MSIELMNVSKQFSAGSHAVNNVSFQINEGEMVAFVGPSGSGKTTLLRMIAGLDAQSSGEIRIRGKRVDQLPPQQRGIGFVFQNYALFRHMTVFDNIAFGLRVKKLKQGEIHSRVNHLLRMMHLTGLEDRLPSQLSGGQRQRVALARALAPEPSVLLLDEPFAAIDSQIRKELRKWVRQIHDEIGITSIFVTHDQEEAIEIADRVLVLNEGRIEQYGSPKEIYDTPQTPFVAGFIGDTNRFVSTVNQDAVHLGTLTLRCPDKEDGTEVTLFIRPSNIHLHANSDIQLDGTSNDVEQDKPHAHGKIKSLLFKGESYAVEVELDQETVVWAHVAKLLPEWFHPGARVHLSVANYQWF